MWIAEERNRAPLLQGRLSQEALEVRQKLRSLAPAEGVGILAWLVETLSRTAQPSSSQHVRTLPAVLQVATASLGVLLGC